MKSSIKKVKLTEKDKLTLLKYLDACTDIDGKGCSILEAKQSSSKLSLNLN